MATLPKKKVGLISCCGEELAEGTISRVATRLVLEGLRPQDTATACLSLFLAGGAEDRAFAQAYPTITIDGCPKLCAKRATEKYSGPVSRSLVVSEMLQASPAPASRRDPGLEGLRQAEAVAQEIARQVDAILSPGATAAQEGIIRLEAAARPAGPGGEGATCACQAGGLPVSRVRVGAAMVGIVGMLALFKMAHDRGLRPGEGTGRDLLKTVKVYNYVPAAAEQDYAEALAREYAWFCQREARR